MKENQCLKSSRLIQTFLIIAFLLVLFFSKEIKAATFQIIDAYIKLSVCGDGIIEGREDCEGEDLNGQTCESLGYGGGELTCDIACSFDTSDCWPLPTPTPTNTPTPTPTSVPTLTSTPTPAPIATLTPTTPTPTSTPATISSSESTTAETDIVAVTPTLTEQTLLEKVIKPRSSLPEIVAFFDQDKSGKIEPEELYDAIASWVYSWRQFSRKPEAEEQLSLVEICDLNRDQVCDLADLSILLYYFDRG